MKILHIIASPPNIFGGISTNVIKLSYELKKYGIDSELLTFNENFQKKLEIIYHNGLKMYCLPSKGFNLMKIFNVSTFLDLFRFFRLNLNKFDIYHIHSYIYFSSLYSILILRLLGKPNILTIRGGVSKLNIKNISFLEKIKIKIFWILYRFLGIYSINKCTILTSVSRKDLTVIRKIFFSRRKSNVFFIPNGIEINSEKFNKEYKRKYITFIGRLDGLKGFDRFIEIAKSVNNNYPSIPILVVGKGPLVSLIKQYSKILNITHIPFIRNENIYKVYLKSKVLIVCSHSEGFSTTILEATSFKTPVISSNIGGASDFIQDGYNGFLYELNNINEAVEKVLILLRDEDLQRIFTTRSFNLVKKNYSIDKITKQYIKVYKKSLKIINYD